MLDTISSAIRGFESSVPNLLRGLEPFLSAARHWLVTALLALTCVITWATNFFLWWQFLALEFIREPATLCTTFIKAFLIFNNAVQYWRCNNQSGRQCNMCCIINIIIVTTTTTHFGENIHLSWPQNAFLVFDSLTVMRGMGGKQTKKKQNKMFGHFNSQ